MRTDSPAVSVVVPAHGRRDAVLRLLADVYRQVGTSYEVIVVDDRGPEDIASAIAAEFPQTLVLQNEINRGPAVTRNRGIRHARGKIVVGFDSDVTLTDTTLLKRALDTFERLPEASVLAFRILTADGRSEDTPRWWHPLPIRQYADHSFVTSYFSGTGYAVRRAAVVEAGLFPELLYMHYEEVELAFRILDNGGSIVYCPDLKVQHHAHPVSRRGEVQTFYKPRNQILVALACYPWPRAFKYLVPRLAYNFMQATAHRHVITFGRALRSAWRLAPQILSTRRPLKPDTWRRIADMRRGLPPATRHGHGRDVEPRGARA
jgi:GT2 family glycosyltransferase